MRWRRTHHHGFTIIEVSLFLAISGMIMVGIMASTAGSINSHRYDDAVQDFTSFLSGLYSSATNVQNTRDCDAAGRSEHERCGQTDQAVYGFIAIFGMDSDNPSTVHTYNLSGSANTETLKDVTTLRDAIVRQGITIDKTDMGQEIKRTYSPLWSSEIQDASGGLFQGAVAIIRSPLDGTLYTYSYNQEQANTLWRSNNPTGTLAAGTSLASGGKIDFCIDSPDLYNDNQRRNIRINAPGRTSSAVEMISVDDEGNACRH